MSARRGATAARPLGLTREKISKEALRLIDAQGLEEFSTRKLGRALGCEAMAIYWHFPSKDALLDAVVEELMADVGHVATAGGDAGDWVDAFRRVAHAYRGLAHDHPRAFVLVATRRFATAIRHSTNALTSAAGAPKISVTVAP